MLTDFGIATLEDRYLLPGETPYNLFERVAGAYTSNPDHYNAILSYMRRGWFMPSTPILSNAGTNRGLPISCFLNEAGDSLEEITELFQENTWLASKGGGIGSYWGGVRSIGENVGLAGKTSGIIPFITVQNALSLAISQGSLRRGSTAVYLPVWHPEILEFLDIRKPTGGDVNRKSLNLHNGVIVDDEFMNCMLEGKDYPLRSPKNNAILRHISAREVWIKILSNRIELGEPYILFKEAIEEGLPEIYKKLGLTAKTSNLCTEILLHTGLDHLQNDRTAVCCLSSVNLEFFEEWNEDDSFIFNIMLMLDNVLQDFITRGGKEFKKAVYSAQRERSVGLGVMGLHTYLQKRRIPLGSVIAKVKNKKIFKYIKSKADQASKKIAHTRGACPDAKEAGIFERFTHKIAVAPTASISIICGGCSPGIEPIVANAYTHKTLSGSFEIRNPNLKKLLKFYNQDTEEVWSSIAVKAGSVQHLSFLSGYEKDIYKTAHEIDQRHLIDLAADRYDYICQTQSLNIFLPGDVHKKELHNIHVRAWKSRKIKSLYYCRSTPARRGEDVSSLDNIEENALHALNKQRALATPPSKEDDECLSCQ